MPARRTPRVPPVTEHDGLRALFAALLGGNADLELPNPLDTLAVDAAVERALSARREALVDRARAAGASWTDVGEALGVTRVSAYGRYGKDSGSGASTGPASDVGT